MSIRCEDCKGSIETDPRRFCVNCPQPSCLTRERGKNVVKPYTIEEEEALNKLIKEARNEGFKV